MKYLLVLALLTGCSAVPAPDVNYTVHVSAIDKINGQRLVLQKHVIDKIIELEKKKIDFNQSVKEHKTPATQSMAAEKPDTSNCENYRDDDPEQFGICLEDAINKIGKTAVNFPAIEISGDNNTVVISSPGAEVNVGGQPPTETSMVTNQLLMMLDTPFIQPPQQPVYKHPVAQAIAETKGLAKELAYPILGGVLGWRITDVLDKGMSRETVSIDGGIVMDSNNPVTTTTYSPAIAE